MRHFIIYFHSAFYVSSSEVLFLLFRSIFVCSICKFVRGIFRVLNWFGIVVYRSHYIFLVHIVLLYHNAVWKWHKFCTLHSLVNFMSHIARRFSIMRFVTFTDFDPHFSSLKEGANHTHIAFSRSPMESDCIKVSIKTVSLWHLQKAKINHSCF